MKFKLTRQEKYWILYDVGNSAFTLLISTIIPIYFNSLAEAGGLTSVQYLAYWGYAASIATLVVALSGPILGAVSDKKGRKKIIFSGSIILGAVGCIALGFARQWTVFLVIFVIARIGYSLSLIFYDSMLADITDRDRIDVVSSQGYAWGYIGSCIPFLMCLGLVLGADFIGISMSTAMLFSFIIVAAWWILASVPLIRTYRQRHYVTGAHEAVKNNLVQLWHTLKEMARTKKVLMFLLAFFFYIDGVYTIIEMATAYGSALGLDQVGLLLALLVTQIVAFPCSILIGRISRNVRPEKLIVVCICAYFCIAVFAMFMSSQIHFWILAFAVGMFQGGIQALSRSYFTKIIPPEKSGEYFGFLDICGKGASFMGTTVISVVSQLTDNVNAGVGAIALFFIIGLVLFIMSVRSGGKGETENEEGIS